MSFTSEELINDLVQTRNHFLKHLRGITAEQTEWKPYPECMSVKEILAHLVCDDRSALDGLRSGMEPDYDAHREQERDFGKLVELLHQSHAELIGYLRERYGTSELDEKVLIWGQERKLGAALAFLTSEDYYHAGQVAFIRMATNPEWDYYGEIFG